MVQINTGTLPVTLTPAEETKVTTSSTAFTENTLTAAMEVHREIPRTTLFGQCSASSATASSVWAWPLSDTPSRSILSQ